MFDTSPDVRVIMKQLARTATSSRFKAISLTHSLTHSQQREANSKVNIDGPLEWRSGSVSSRPPDKVLYTLMGDEDARTRVRSVVSHHLFFLSL